MATVREIGVHDHVALLEPVDKVPLGATGAVLELHNAGKFAMVEFTSMPPEPLLDRIAFVPLDKLRLTNPHGAAAADSDRSA
jgi:hypothetical protein